MRKSKEADKCKAMLKEFAKRPENKYCADCGQKQPGWASTNIGVIVCIHCSGIHRKMGVHISFVKSLSLDQWKMVMCKKFMAQGGNKNINKIYEAKLKKGLKPTDPTNMRVLEQFIRDKYERKKWYSAKKRKKQEEQSSDESAGESSSEESTVEKPVKKKKSRRRRRPKPAKKKEVVQKRVVPAAAVPLPQQEPQVEDLLKFDGLSMTTQAPPQADSGFMLEDLSPRGPAQPAQSMGFVKAQSAPVQLGFQQDSQPQGFGMFQSAPPAQQQTQVSDKDRIMNLLKGGNQSQQNNPSNNNIFTQINQPQRPQQFGMGYQQPPQQSQFARFGQSSNPMTSFGVQQPRQYPGFGQQPNPMASFGRPQQQMGFGMMGQQPPQQQQPQMGFGQAPNQMGYGQQQGFGFQQQPQPQWR